MTVPQKTSLKRTGPLRTVGDVLREAARLYRHARRGELQTSDAARLAQLLREIRTCIESGDVEARLHKLEQKIAGGDNAS